MNCDLENREMEKSRLDEELLKTLFSMKKNFVIFLIEGKRVNAYKKSLIEKKPLKSKLNFIQPEYFPFLPSLKIMDL